MLWRPRVVRRESRAKAPPLDSGAGARLRCILVRSSPYWVRRG